MLLNNKIIVVAGGAGLIGAGFVKSIIENGATAIIADIDDKKTSKVIKNLSQNLPLKQIDSFKLNITSKKSLQECVKYVDSKYGKIDALVNNTYPRNKNYGKDFFNTEYEDFVENLGTNLDGCFIS